MIGCGVQPPLEEVHVFGVFDESSSHHDGLETLTVDGPQLHMDQSWKTHTLSMQVITHKTPEPVINAPPVGQSEDVITSCVSVELCACGHVDAHECGALSS